MNNGWIKIHRKLLDNPIANKPHYLSVWITLLLLASHKEYEVLVGDKKILIKRGQLLTGRKKLAEATGVQESKIERILKRLENDQQIEQQSTNKFRLITINNYDSYQIDEQQNEQQMNNKRTTNEQQMNTYKKVKNVKKVKKGGRAREEKSNKLSFGNEGKVKLTQQEYTKLCQTYGGVAVDRMITRIEDYVLASGKSYKSYAAAIRNWFRKDLDEGKVQIKFIDFRKSDFDSEEEFRIKTNKLS